MIETFLNKNKLAVKAGLIGMSIIFTSLVLIIFLIGYFNGQKPDLELFLTVVLCAAVGFPLFAMTVGFLRWWWDYSVINRNFNSFPFNELASIGFEKSMRNKNSKSKFTSEFYTRNLNGFIVDCEVDTQHEPGKLVFKIYVKTKHVDKSKYREIETTLSKKNGFFDFDFIGKKYHYKRHQLQSIKQLDQELHDFVGIIKSEDFETKIPSH